MAFDLAIIGSGGAAFAAAIAARREDRSVVMVERGTVGGTCVNTGCVPSKALLAAAEARQIAVSAEHFPGIRAGADEVAFAEFIAGKDDLVAGMQAENKWIWPPSTAGRSWAARLASSTGRLWTSSCTTAARDGLRLSTM